LARVENRSARSAKSSLTCAQHPGQKDGLRTAPRLFETTDDSVSALIRERRLSRCHTELLRGTDESVTAIAYRWGFRNLSFFSRQFHEQYGVPARELQRAARAAAHPQEGTR
jgi:transcriptional regulator GlxA family with amidase domain